jgi:hypothetical protein
MAERVRQVLLALVLSAGLAVTPLAGGAPVAAQTPPPPHWGQSPYYPNCLEGPCRVVVIADKTEHAGYQAQIQRWVAWMNYVRVNYNLNFPAFVYADVGPDPGCATAEGIISVCRSDAIVDADCGTNPDFLRCGVYNVELGVGHIRSVRASFRTRELDAADTWTVVCGQLGRAIGLAASTDQASCLYSGTFILGSGQERYYVLEDWLQMFAIYNHSAID